MIIMMLLMIDADTGSIGVGVGGFSADCGTDVSGPALDGFDILICGC